MLTQPRYTGLEEYLGTRFVGSMRATPVECSAKNLLGDVGYGIYVRCQDLLKVSHARRGRVKKTFAHS